jgi:hypothetical protein
MKLCRLAVFVGLVASTACVAGREPAACAVLSADDIAQVLQRGAVTTAEGSGLNTTTGIDTCRWTADGNARVELRLYRADSSAEGAWKMVFESAQVHATQPDAAGRTRARSLTGVGDDAMVLQGSGGGPSVAFRVGRTGAVIVGTGSEEGLIELAKRAAKGL